MEYIHTEQPEVIFFIGNSHTPHNPSVVSTSEYWKTPFNTYEIDNDILFFLF